MPDFVDLQADGRLESNVPSDGFCKVLWGMSSSGQETVRLAVATVLH